MNRALGDGGVRDLGQHIDEGREFSGQLAVNVDGPSFLILGRQAQDRACRAVGRRSYAEKILLIYAATLEVLAEESAGVEHAVAQHPQTLEPLGGDRGMKRLVQQEGEGAFERLLGARVGSGEVREERDQIGRGA